MYWWITTHSGDGKLVVLGPYSTEESANDYAFRHLGSNFEAHQLGTKDVAKATRILKKLFFDRVGNLDQALERARHKFEEKK